MSDDPIRTVAIFAGIVAAVGIGGLIGLAYLIVRDYLRGRG